MIEDGGATSFEASLRNMRKLRRTYSEELGNQIEN